jgi:hypothetical protein
MISVKKLHVGPRTFDCRHVIVSLSLLATTFTQAQSWQNVGQAPIISGTHEYINIEFSPSGEPHIATEEDLTGQAMVRKFDGAAWVDVGPTLITADNARYLDLEFSPSGEPYIAYQDYSTATSSITVQRFDGANWVNVGTPGFLGDFDESPKLGFSSSGTPYVAVKDGPGGVITVSSFGGNNWAYVGPPPLSSNPASVYDIDFDSNDSPHVLFRHSPQGIPYSQVKHFDGNNWVSLDSISTELIPFSMAISSTDEVYVACQDQVNGDKITVLKFDGASWNTVGSPNFSVGIAQFYSLTFGPTGTPYVAYNDNGVANKTVVKMFDGSDWQTVGTEGFSDGNATSQEVRVSPTGVPYVIYDDVFNLGVTVMRFDSANVVNELSLGEQILAYPIPVNDLVTLHIPLHLKTNSLEIISVLGHSVYIIDTNGSSDITIDLSGLQNGMYLIMGHGTDKSVFWRKKLVKR